MAVILPTNTSLHLHAEAYLPVTEGLGKSQEMLSIRKKLRSFRFWRSRELKKIALISSERPAVTTEH